MEKVHVKCRTTQLICVHRKEMKTSNEVEEEIWSKGMCKCGFYVRDGTDRALDNKRYIGGLWEGFCVCFS